MAPSSFWLRTPPQLKGETLTRQGCTLHYWTAGPADRPLVAMTHGATQDHRMFNAQVEALLPEYRVMVWDVRAHGRSAPAPDSFEVTDCAADLLAILDQIGADQAVLVGQSFGGYVSQFAYRGQPNRVRAMVVIGATSIALPYTKLEMFGLKASLTAFALWPYGHYKRMIARNTALRPEVQEYALHAADQIPRRTFLAIWRAVVTGTISEKGLPGEKINVPLLLTHGDHDRTGSIRRQAPIWATYEPDVTYEVIADAGHSANQDQPEEFNRVLLRFLRERAPAGDEAAEAKLETETKAEADAEAEA